MQKTVEGLIEVARRLPVPQQLALIERLAQSIQKDLEAERMLREELAAWDALSDEALGNFETRL